MFPKSLLSVMCPKSVFFFFPLFSYTGSSLRCMGFLYLGHMGASLVIAHGLLLLGCKVLLWAFPRSATHLLEGFHISFKLTRDLFPTFNINSYLTGSHWFCEILLPFTSMWGSVVAVLGLSCMRDLSSLDRDQTLIPCIGRWILNH